jgi:hypothetical protein
MRILHTDRFLNKKVKLRKKKNPRETYLRIFVNPPGKLRNHVEHEVLGGLNDVVGGLLELLRVGHEPGEGIAAEREGHLGDEGGTEEVVEDGLGVISAGVRETPHKKSFVFTF